MYFCHKLQRKRNLLSPNNGNEARSGAFGFISNRDMITTSLDINEPLTVTSNHVKLYNAKMKTMNVNSFFVIFKCPIA